MSSPKTQHRSSILRDEDLESESDNSFGIYSENELDSSSDKTDDTINPLLNTTFSWDYNHDSTQDIWEKLRKDSREYLSFNFDGL